MRLPAFLLAVLLLAGCSNPAPAVNNVAEDAAIIAGEAVEELDENAEDVAVAAGKVAVPTVIALREVVEAIESIPSVEAQEVPTQRNTSTAVDSAAVDLVVRWEVGSPAQYTRKYQGVICPGGASGPTIGIGDDLGHQTQAEIRRRWGWHPDVDRMVTASGVTGPGACTAWRKSHIGIRVSYDDAIRVFQTFAWPKYSAMASRAYRNGWASLTPNHQSSLTSNGYNRGFSFLGSRRTELVTIRDQCVPVSNAPCTAAQLRASCRVWDSQPTIRKGLCARRNAEADFAIR